MAPMAWRRCVVGLAAGLLVAALSGQESRSVGPPAAVGPVKLTRQQEARLEKLGAEQAKSILAGDMGRALRLAQEEASLRRQWQGARHWQTIDARYGIERWSRQARLSPVAQKEAGRAVMHEALGMTLHVRGQYSAAEKSCREALAIRTKALGEEHLDTAQSYNNVAFSLRAQGKAAQALTLFDKALAIRKKVLGEEHPDTATSYNNVASCLNAQGKAAQALPLYEKALTILKKVLGEEHPTTAASYNNVASCLQTLDKGEQALPLLEKALVICKKVRGEEHPDTAASYNNVAGCLKDLGKAAQALLLFEKALDIWKKVRGEEHPDTARSYNNVASCLHDQGKAAQALPLYEKALAIRKKVLGEEHPSTATSYNGVASCLCAQGKAAQALPLYEKALAIRKKVLGEEHPDTARSYNHVASCLQDQGKAGQALPLYEKALAIKKQAMGEDHTGTATSYNDVASCLQAQGKAAPALQLYQKALAIRKKVLGEGHPHTALSYNNVAYCLQDQGKAAQALPLLEKALALFKKVLGEEHPDTARSYNNVAMCLNAQGKAAQALPLFEKALAIKKKVLGEEHPDTARSYNNVAFCLYDLGKHREAIAGWRRALLGFDFGRLARAEHGFDRARFGADYLTPRRGLALAHARLKEGEKAWQYAEADLARNLLDDLAGAAPEDIAAANHLRQLDERLLPLFGLARPTLAQKTLLAELTRERQVVLAQQAKRAATRSAGLVASLADVQKQLPAEAAVVFWVDTRGANWACVVRSQGPPRWVPLAGSGVKAVWAVADYEQPNRLHDALADPLSSPTRRRELREAVQKRWFTPLEKHLKAEGKLPAVARLFVVSPKHFNGLPVEVLAPGYTVSYTPSATVLAKALKGHRALKAAPALALGDPVYQAPVLAAVPMHGVFVATVQANGAAHKAGLRAGDVLLRYDGAKLESVADLVAALKKNPKGKATYWRDGKETTVALQMPLGLSVGRLPGPEAVRAYRAANTSVTDGDRFAPLPGTRAEVLALQALLGKDCRTLLGSAASEQKLDAMRQELKSYRVLHLATHGGVNLSQPEHSRLILARDQLPTLSENAARAARGQRPYTGELTVQTILQDWTLDADLVVLSACQTGLGQASSGDGALGFSYALQRVGARSVVLSRWKVDDTATALLMVRFYENLLGKAQGLTKPMGRAEALAEAKQWLRELPKKDAEKLAIALNANKLSGTRGSIVELNVKEKPKLPAGDRPFEHPFFWAAFVLIGDPD